MKLQPTDFSDIENRKDNFAYKVRINVMVDYANKYSNQLINIPYELINRVNKLQYTSVENYQYYYYYR